MQDVQDSSATLLCKDFSISKKNNLRSKCSLKKIKNKKAKLSKLTMLETIFQSLKRNLDYYKEHATYLKHVLRLSNLLHFSCLLRQNSCLEIKGN